MSKTSETPPDLNTDQQTTHFGFETVNVDEKAGMVRNVFDNVAQQYDIMNDAMSGGMHRLWKNSLIDSLKPFAGMSHLDVAGGTGDIAFRVLDAIRSNNPEADLLEKTTINVSDINESMLTVGRDRAIDRGDMNCFDFTVGNAETLPFGDMTQDAYTIAFGIRNVTRIPMALSEAYRVLKPGGRLLVLEFSEVALPLMKEVYEKYSFNVVPILGEMIANDRESYQYLVESIRKFPNQETFAGMISDAGFSRVSYRNMTGGVVALHSAWRL